MSDMILVTKITSRKVIFYFGKIEKCNEFKRIKTKLYVGNINNKINKFSEKKDLSLYYTKVNKNTIHVPSLL